jgi:hypothetical protein
VAQRYNERLAGEEDFVAAEPLRPAAAVAGIPGIGDFQSEGQELESVEKKKQRELEVPGNIDISYDYRFSLQVVSTCDVMYIVDSSAAIYILYGGQI